MKLFLKILLIIAIIIVFGLIAGIVWFNSTFPKVSPPPDIKVNATPELIERGKYLANHVAACIDCHSTRDWSRFAGPIIPGTEGKGGDIFNKETSGVPGTLFTSNITPSGIGNWTDGELYRAITSGVTKTGKVIFPIMPWHSYSKFDPADVKAIIAYIRSLKPIENKVGESSLDFPLNFIMKTLPADPQPTKLPAKSDTLAYGKYLAIVAACADCHTPANDKGQKLPGMDYAGGFEFKLGPMGIVRSVNITPDANTGIGSWTLEMFISKFKKYSDMSSSPKLNKGEMQSVMPWYMYSGMDTTDLAAIYKYLRTVKPVKNAVARFTPAS